MFFKKLAAGILAAAIAVTSVTAVAVTRNNKTVTAQAADDTEVRGVWMSVYDFADRNIGLYTDDEDTFRQNAADFITDMQDYHLNTLYFQVRAFDDAAWKSKTFPAMTYISPSAKALGSKNSSRKASGTLKFDPLKVMVEEAHKQNVVLIAWMNPYRINSQYYLNPASLLARNRVNKAVKEVMKYDVDGVVFDDYFYHASSGYRNSRNGRTTLTAARAAKLSKNTKARNVNKLIKKVYSTVHKANSNATFGVAPQGNLTNDQAAGADVKTWLSKTGYIDYLMPQLYWTDEYGSDGDITMFSDRLEQFGDPDLNTAGIPEYAALALYRCGHDNYYLDDGWVNSTSNLAEQYQKLKAAGWQGYSLFSARYLYDDEHAGDELGYLNEALGE